MIPIDVLERLRTEERRVSREVSATPPDLLAAAAAEISWLRLALSKNGENR